MQKVTTKTSSNPEPETDPEVIAFRTQFEDKSPLDELFRLGAQ